MPILLLWNIGLSVPGRKYAFCKMRGWRLLLHGRRRCPCRLRGLRSRKPIGFRQWVVHIIDPYSVNKQGVDVGEKYRTGIYSTAKKHLDEAKDFIERQEDKDKIVVEVLPLSNYVRSAEEHQHHLKRHPEDCSYCHIPDEVLNKYRMK